MSKIIHYHKLIRDRIPEIIKAAGKSCETRILGDAEYLEMVDAKLDEELKEYHKDQNIEELADLMEIIYAAAKAQGYSPEQLEDIRAAKAKKNGAFEKKILLLSVTEGKTEVRNRLLEKKEAILEGIDNHTLMKYVWLQKNLLQCDVSQNEEYQKNFVSFYRMRFASKAYRKAFFESMEAQKNGGCLSFEEISRRLYPIDNKHEFSFISKLIHTLDPTRPIYDSKVDAVLGLKRSYRKDFESCLKRDNALLSEISRQYDFLKNDSEIRPILDCIDEMTRDFIMTDEKKVDFLLWMLGKIETRPQR